MHVSNNKKTWFRLLLKSLLVIISMQLVVLQVKAITVSSTHHQPCSQMEMATDFIPDEHQHTHHDLVSSEHASDKCLHCEDISQGCYSGCHISPMYSLSFVSDLELTQLTALYLSSAENKLVSLFQQPGLQPPR